MSVELGKRSSTKDLETILFRTADGQQRSCPHLAWGRPYLVTCKRRDCPRCGRPWALSWETVLRKNLAHYGGEVALITVTAPGAELLPWACERSHVHSGAKGCTVVDDAADRWSLHARDNWKCLRDAARKKTIKNLGMKPSLLARVWEPQKRGVPHLHIVLGLGSEVERIAARRFVDELARLAPDYFFGFVDRKITSLAAAEAARYLSGYLVGRSGKKETIRTNISDPRMPRSLIWVSAALTKVTLVTMRRLRIARWYFAALRGVCAVYPKMWGEDAVKLATLAALLEPLRARPPNEDDRGRFLRHFKNVRLMRVLEEAA